VVLVNMVFIGIEADTGLLSSGKLHWSGLAEDVRLLGGTQAQAQAVEAQVRGEVHADVHIKDDLERSVNRTLKKEHLGMDLDGVENKRLWDSGAYTAWEYMLLVFFVVEMCLRICDIGCKAYCLDPWRPLDVAIVFLGCLDLGLPLFVGESPSATTEFALSLLRMTRVLRALKLFRLCPELKVLGGACGKAFFAVLRVGLFIFILDFVIAVCLTSLLGSKAHLWDDKAEEVDARFGSIGRSLRTLFALMTFTGWGHTAHLLGDVLPVAVVVPCLVLYVSLCSLAALSLVNGMVSDSFVASQHESEKRSAQRTERHRSSFMEGLATALSSCHQNRNGYLSRDGFKMALEAHPVVLSRLRSLDVHANEDELLQLFDRLCKDSPAGTSVGIDSLVEAIGLLSGTAKASEVFDLKYLVRAMRRDAAERSGKIESEANQRHDDQALELRAAKAMLGKVQQEVTLAKDATSSFRQELDGLHEQLQTVQKRAEKEAAEHRVAVAAISTKVDVLSSQLAGQASLHERLTTLTDRVSQQAAPAELVSKFASELVAKLTTPSGLSCSADPSETLANKMTQEVDKMTQEAAPAEFVPEFASDFMAEMAAEAAAEAQSLGDARASEETKAANAEEDSLIDMDLSLGEPSDDKWAGL